MNKGWKCPTCGIGVSPFVSACPECVKTRNNRPPKDASTAEYSISIEDYSSTPRPRLRDLTSVTYRRN